VTREEIIKAAAAAIEERLQAFVNHNDTALVRAQVSQLVEDMLKETDETLAQLQLKPTTHYIVCSGDDGVLHVDIFFPRYVHDCKSCVFLGCFGEYDLYYCPQGGKIPTVVARYGDKPPQYSSGLYGDCALPCLAEARKRAVEKGLIECTEE
jgi:hypothetical protein